MIARALPCTHAVLDTAQPSLPLCWPGSLTAHPFRAVLCQVEAAGAEAEAEVVVGGGPPSFLFDSARRPLGSLL